MTDKARADDIDPCPGATTLWKGSDLMVVRPSSSAGANVRKVPRASARLSDLASGDPRSQRVLGQVVAMPARRPRSHQPDKAVDAAEPDATGRRRVNAWIGDDLGRPAGAGRGNPGSATRDAGAVALLHSARQDKKGRNKGRFQGILRPRNWYHGVCPERFFPQTRHRAALALAAARPTVTPTGSARIARVLTLQR